MLLPFRSLALGFTALLASLASGGPALRAADPAPAATAAAAAADAVRPATPRPALWKISDPDTTIWLFGTVHALPAGVNWLHGPVEQALAGSDQLVTEIPETSAAQMQSAVISNAVLPAQQNLRGLMDEAQKAKFEKALAGFELPVEAFDRFEPWYAAVALTTLPLAREGYTAGNGVEETISAVAAKRGKPRIGLETAAQQLAMFDALPMEVQKHYLAEVVENLPTIDKELAEMIAAWSAGDAEKLAALVNSDQDDPRMVEALLTGRNRTWAEWIGKRMAQPGTVFMAVGAGHLAGKDSVQAFLARRGITVTRVQ